MTLHSDNQEYGIDLSILGVSLVISQGVFIALTELYLEQRNTIMASFIGGSSSLVGFGRSHFNFVDYSVVIFSIDNPVRNVMVGAGDKVS